jgi:hypothetical protein
MRPKTFKVTVSYALRVLALDEAHAKEIVSDMTLPRNYVTDSFDITNVSENPNV